MGGWNFFTKWSVLAFTEGKGAWGKMRDKHLEKKIE